MTTYLLDRNVLIAFTTADHQHHDVVWKWFGSPEPRVATCPITEGALLRYQIRVGNPAPVAVDYLQLLRSNDWHEFWPDDLPFSDAVLDGVIGHRQVTDAYLAALAVHHQGRLVTLDKGLKAAHPEVLLLTD